jgi:ABC-type branched-subunit amino acid transport system substrate-binding protein
VFAPLSKSLVQGTQLFWKQQNAAGGVCGRTVEVTVKDHGYDPQKAVSAYREISSDVLGMQTVLGSPVISALKPTVAQDNMYVGVAGWSASVLATSVCSCSAPPMTSRPSPGWTISCAARESSRVTRSDTSTSRATSARTRSRAVQYLAGQKGLTIVGQKIKASDTDLSAQVTTFRNEGVKAILVSAGPTQTASVAGVAKSVGLSVPIVANGPGFTPQLLASPAGPALKENLTVVSSMAPPSLDKPAATQLQAAFVKEYPDGVPTQVGSLFGYVQARSPRTSCRRPATTRTSPARVS